MSEIGAASGTSASRPLNKLAFRPDAATGIVAASAFLVFAIVGIFVLLCVQGYDSTLMTARAKAQRAADSVAEGTRWIVSSALATLSGIADARAAGAAPDAGLLADFIALRAGTDLPFELAMFDASGTFLAASSSIPGLPGFTDSALFASLAGGKSWAMSAQEAGPVTGAPSFFIARRIDIGGTFSGVALLVLPGQLLDELAGPMDLGEGGTISIIRADGWVIARHPSLSAPLSVAGTPSFRDLSENDSGTYDSAVSPADGLPRLVAFRRVEQFGYVAVASIARNTALAGLWNAIWIVSLLIAPIAVAVLGGSLVTANLLRKTVATSRSLAAALEHNEALFQEIHHRVKNNLQSVNALLRLQPIPPELREEISTRIFAMSSVHEHMYRSRNFSTVSVRDYLHTLIANIGAGYRSDLTLVEDIEDLQIHRDLATPLGLIVNEVVANSFKHGFPEGRMGAISVRVTGEPGGMARLVIADDGVGFDPDLPAQGMGRRLVTRFAQQLGASVDHTGSDGARFTLVFPLSPSGS